MVAGALLAQIGRQTVHRYFPRRFVGRRAVERETLLAAARAHEALVEVHYLQNANLPCLYAALRGLNLAELAGRSPELARGYATLGAIAGFVPLPGLADAYCRRALETARAIGDLPAEIWASLTVAVYKVGVAAWDEAQTLLGFVLSESQRLGDSRRWEDGAQNMAAAHYLQGRFDQSLRWATDLLDSGTRRNDPRAQASALQRAILCLLALGRDAEAAARLAEINGLQWDAGPTHSELPLCTLRALVAERAGDPDAALAAARDGAAILAKLTPAFHENLIDASGVTDVLLRLLERADGVGRKVEALRALKPALAALRRVARVFPIARAWLALHEGRAERVRGREERAQRRWRDAVVSAETLGMPEPGALAQRLMSGVR
jgi:tetratricopeptide (TPR) repeat protein